MTNISAGMVKDLRDKTGAGMMDCKTALAETQGDIESAVDWLRKKGLAKAAKKAGRIAADGLIGIAAKDGRGAVVEVNSETDFVARGGEFQNFVRKAAEHALKAEGDLERLLGSAAEDGASISEVLSAMVGKIGENMSVRRSAALSVNPGVVASYVHNAVAADLGKIGVLVALESPGDAGKLMALGKQLAMHVAAANPLALSVEELAPDVVARERAIFADQARQSGKPENVIEKMIEGRLRKFYEESVLLQQVFVIDGETPVAKVVEKTAKDLGAPIRVAGFVRFAVGEGIDKPTTDFAAEVKATAGL
ncbi:MAG TPA: translation elongation factor Ts [Micropepsaceae bacterium]|jgi:elongation factor Ts|nr:translation elongation factor Ts [Micropepsaceae bacterium]